MVSAICGFRYRGVRYRDVRYMWFPLWMCLLYGVSAIDVSSIWGIRYRGVRYAGCPL